MVFFLKKNKAAFLIALLIIIVCFMGINISLQNSFINKLHEDSNYTYIRCLEQIAERIEDIEKVEDTNKTIDNVSLRNASSWAGKAVVISKNINFQKKPYLESIAIMLDEFFSNTTRPELAIKTGSIYKLVPCLRSVAKNPNDKQEIDSLIYILQGTY